MTTAYSPAWRDLALAFCAARDATDHPAGPGVAAAQSQRSGGTVPGPRSPQDGPGTTKTSRGAGVVGASATRAVGASASAPT